MSNEAVEAIERNIKVAKEIVEVGNALMRLKSNKDFKTVVMTGYFEKEAIRLVHLKADINMQSAEMQRSIVSQMDAIGALSQYFNTVMYKSSIANKSVEADQEMIEEMASEDLNNV